MLLPGLFAPNTPESTEGKRLGPFADSAADGATTGFGQIFSEFKAGLMPASVPVSMANFSLPFGSGEMGQGLPLERQALGFKGISPIEQPLLALQMSLSELGDTIDQILSLEPEQQAELADYLSSELGMTDAQQVELFELLKQWQQTPPSVALTAEQLEEAGQEGLDAVRELGEILDLLNEELLVWREEAAGNRTVAEDSGSRLESIRENPYLAQWLLGEGRPDKGSFTAADWLSQTMQQLMKSASSGSIPMTLEPMRPEALLLATVDAEPKQQTQTLDLDLLAQSRQARTEARMEAQLLSPMEGVPLTPERGLASPVVEEKGVLTPILERLQRPVPMAQANQALTERLVIMIQNEMSHATIRLDPPELGLMDIRIQVQNDQTQIQILVQTPQVREALESQSTRLREFLEQQGLALGDLDVTDQQQQNEQQEDEQREGSEAMAGQTGQGLDEGESLTKQPLGLVDHFV